MRTNIVLDDKLVSEAQKITGLKTRRALVDYSLRELIRRNKQKDLTRLFGKIHWDGDLDKLRQREEILTMILVDTSVWIDYFRGNKCPEAAVLDRLLRDSDVCICGPILSELLQGVRTDSELKEVRDFANVLVYLPFHDRYFLDAAYLYRTCRIKGVTIRKTIACFIAACAIDNKVALHHADSDFTALAQYTPLVLYAQ